MRLEDHTRYTEAALGGSLLQKGLLNGVQNRIIVIRLHVVRGRGQTLDGNYFPVLRATRCKQTGFNRLAVHQHNTATTLTIITGFLSASQVKLLAQHIKKRV